MITNLGIRGIETLMVIELTSKTLSAIGLEQPDIKMNPYHMSGCLPNEEKT